MMNEHILREKARAAIANGRFPNRRQDRIWGGTGVGVRCTICDLAVGATEMEFEVTFAHDGDDPGFDKYHVHVPCFAAWEFEREGSSPTCDACLMTVQPGEPIVFREDGRLEHVDCHTLRCIRCLRAIHDGEPTSRSGDGVVHRACPEPFGAGAPVDSDSS